MLSNVKDIAGKEFGHLTAVRYSGEGKWLCICDCGRNAIVITSNLTKGNTRSCGADFHREKHGMSLHPLNGVWRAMRARCSNPKDLAYKNYGGRGIKVCERWSEFANFYADMGDRPDGYQIDRTDNDGPYSPENCRWVHRRDNLNNKRTSRKLEWNGETLTVAQWAERTKLHPRTIQNRIVRSGWSVERALTTPTSKGDA